MLQSFRANEVTGRQEDREAYHCKNHEEKYLKCLDRKFYGTPRGVERKTKRERHVKAVVVHLLTTLVCPASRL